MSVVDGAEDLGDALQLLTDNISSISSQMDDLDSQVDLLDSLLIQAKKNITHPPQMDKQQMQLNKTTSELRSQASQLDRMSVDLDNQASQLETMCTLEDSQESRVDRLSAQLHRQQYRLDELTNRTANARSVLKGEASRTELQQTLMQKLTVKLEQLDKVINLHPRDCSELPAWVPAGNYSILPDPSKPPVQVFCQSFKDNEKRWTVFQRRVNMLPRVDFYRYWDDYKHGFGNVAGEFWLGLEILHQLTFRQKRTYQLRIDLEAFDGGKAYALYQNFKISSERDGYKLLSASGYRGNAGDSLKTSIGRNFSTRDKDNSINWGNSGKKDFVKVDCPRQNEGAWWFWGPECGLANLNGPYHVKHIHFTTGIWWFSWRRYESMKKVEMQIRPAF